MALMSQLLLLVTLLAFLRASVSSGDATYEELSSFGKDEKSVVHQKLLLKVLTNLNKIFHPKLDDTNHQRDEISGESSSENDVNEDLPLSKRENVFGVLPPWNEFCRMMHLTSCIHSRHR